MARTLKLTTVLALLAFIALMFVSFLSVQSIDSSLGEVVSVDQPSGEAVSDMTHSADEATIAFLESLVSDVMVSSRAPEDAFYQALTQYEDLVGRTSAVDAAERARALFERLSNLGRQLVDADQERRKAFIAVQFHMEELDDAVEKQATLSEFEGDVEENARLISNYVAAPTAQNKLVSLEELDEFIGELVAGLRDSRSPSQRTGFTEMLFDLRQAKQLHLRMIFLTERSARLVPLFRSTRSELDLVLNEDIDRVVETNLETRSQQAGRTVESSKSILIVSLGAGLAMGLAALLWVRRRITQPVGRLMGAIEGLGQAEGSIDVDLDRDDEFGVLARALVGAAGQRRTLEAQLREQALHDPLTGLANRTLFKDRVEHALGQQREDGTRIAVAFVDIDDFKTVNDSLGHGAGDALLISVAQRLRESVRTSDTPARLGGDEFAVLLSDVGEIADAAIPAQNILQAIAAPIDVGDKQISVRGSIGIAIYEEGQGAADLLRNADVAMYGAKTEGKGRFKIFDETMHSAAVERFQLKDELIAAIEKSEFRLHYQPIKDLETGRTQAMEALLRWQHPERGLIGPGEFIELAEETGAIVPIFRWVMHSATTQAVTWRRSAQATDLRICVNVSPSQLNDPGLIVDVKRGLASSGLPPAALVLEITENVLVVDGAEVLSTLHELAGLGVVVAIDDFGSGYSSLGYLSKLPITMLKIDRSFVHAIDKSPEEGAVAHVIIRLGRALGLEIVAEGIETRDQLSELQRLQCPLGQGFLLDRPAPAEAIELQKVVQVGAG